MEEGRCGSSSTPSGLAEPCRQTLSASVVSGNWVDDVAPPFRGALAGLQPGAIASALSRHFVDTTLAMLRMTAPPSVFETRNVPPSPHCEKSVLKICSEELLPAMGAYILSYAGEAENPTRP